MSAIATGMSFAVISRRISTVKSANSGHSSQTRSARAVRSISSSTAVESALQISDPRLEHVVGIPGGQTQEALDLIALVRLGVGAAVG